MKEKDDDRNHPCYVGIDDMGNIVGAVVHEKDKPERSAVWVAGWIMDGLTVKLTTVGDVRENFGQKFEGPSPPPVLPYHVRVLTRNAKGKIEAECEGDEELLKEYNDESLRFSKWDDDLAPDEETKVYGEKAIEVLETLFDGREDWKRVRTLGDFDVLRLQIAGVRS